MLSFFRNHRFELLLVAFYTVVAPVITFPLILNFNSSIYSLPEEYVLEANVPYSTPVRNADAYGAIWEFWWYKQAFLQDVPWESSPLLGISGVRVDDGLLHMPLINFVARGITILTNEVFAFNILTLLSFPLAGLSMYLLAFCLTRDKRAAALAGFIFAFAPLHRRYSFEWLGMAQWHWVPLYVLALLKLDQTRSVRWGLLAGLMFAITFVENYYFGYFTIFFTFFFVLFRLIHTYVVGRRFYLDRVRLWSFLLAMLTIVVLTLPATTTFLRESRKVAMGEETQLGGFVRDEWQRFALSARPWYFVLPDVNNPVLGGLTTRFYNWVSTKPPYFLTQPFYPREHTLFLGWTTLILSAAAIIVALRTRKSEIRNTKSETYIWLFLFLGIVMAIFSAPPYATISLHKIYFPSHFLYKIFPMFRSYARFGVLVLLCFSILAAFGAKLLFERIKSPHRCFLALLFFCSLVFFEFLDFPPFHNVSLRTLPVYEYLAEQDGDFAILVYPEDISNFDLLAQRVHGKRFLNPKGRTGSEVREIYDYLAEDSAINKLRDWGVRYVLIRRDSSLGLEKTYDLVKTFSNPTVYLFEVPRP